MAGCTFSSPDQCASDLATAARRSMAKSFADSASYALTKCTEVWLRAQPGRGRQLFAFGVAVQPAQRVRSGGHVRLGPLQRLPDGDPGRFDHLGDLGKSLARLFVVSGVVGVATTAGLAWATR